MLKVSTKGRYGLRAMMDLAQHYGQGPVMMSDISRSQGLSRKYLHALLTSLREAGLVHSVLGAKGGYYLAKPPLEIRVREIVEALEGPISVVDCVTKADKCGKLDSCAARLVWTNLTAVITKALDGVTLDDFVNGSGLLADDSRSNARG
ncbi:MAG: Rrf2 family transcriptional regulator [Myxococcota bacterium]|jgi:Rrf2 family protein|nr:Rrf2 family transcriptional regulator [Myxococcota bacterium]